jgi:nucleoside-diphosphate-sugar epimerase
MYTILVAGAGYTGGTIARFFTAKKQRVYALTRSAEKAKSFESEGIRPLIMDLTKPETVMGLPQAQFVVIAVAPDDRTEEAYRRTYVEGVGNLLTALQKDTRPLLVVYLSSTGVWPDQGGGWVDESMRAIPDSERSQILLQAENQVLNSGLPSVVVRLAGIYGPGRNRLAALRKTDSFSKMPETQRWMNLIHVEDIAESLPLIFKKSEAGTIITCVDDEPVASSEFYEWLTCHAGTPKPPEFLQQPIQGKRIRNTLLKSFGYQFQYPTFREGYRAILAAEKKHEGGGL